MNESATPDSRDGLTQAEAQDRLARYGYNELTEKKVNPLLKFLTYFWGPIPWMIEAAVILSAVVGDWTDFAIILALLLANAVIGFWEESQAGNAIAALKGRLALSARVKRDGVWASLPARELVPGDLIRIRLGDIVPADAALLGLATTLGIVGVFESFGLFYLGERVFHLDRATIQTLMYRKLSVAGQMPGRIEYEVSAPLGRSGGHSPPVSRGGEA